MNALMRTFVTVGVLAFGVGAAGAYGVCEGRFFDPTSQPDWNNMTPITIAGVRTGSGREPGLMGMSTPCTCGTLPVGVGMTYWEPTYLAEVARTPGCFSTLGGEKILSGFENQMSQGRDGRRRNYSSARLQVHWYRYPIFQVLSMATGLGCMSTGGYTLADMTELHDWWQDDQWNIIAYPEALLFVNPLAAISCAVDGVTASVRGIPLDSMFWCVGHQGPLYPVSGNVQAYRSPLSGNVHALGKYIAAHTRNGGLLATIGPTARCGASYLPFWIKSQYRLDIVEPVALRGTITFGMAEERWGLTPPAFNAVRTDAAYMIWVGRQCCDVPGI